METVENIFFFIVGILCLIFLIVIFTPVILVVLMIIKEIFFWLFNIPNKENKEDKPSEDVFYCNGYGSCCDNASCSGCAFYQQWLESRQQNYQQDN